MEGHLSRKHEIAEIEDVEVLKELIRRCALQEVDAKILYMAHVERQDQYYIADKLGMSVQNVRKRYYAALAKLYRLAQIQCVVKKQ